DLQMPALLRAAMDFEAGFAADDTGLRVSGVEARTAGATLTGEGGLRWPTRALTGRFALAAPDLAALQLEAPAGVDPSGSLQGEGTIAGWLDRAEVRLRLAGADLRVAGQPFRSLSAEASLQGDATRLDSLELQQEEGRLTLSGARSPRAMALHVRAHAIDLAP